MSWSLLGIFFLDFCAAIFWSAAFYSLCSAMHLSSDAVPQPIVFGDVFFLVHSCVNVHVHVAVCLCVCLTKTLCMQSLLTRCRQQCEHDCMWEGWHVIVAISHAMSGLILPLMPMWLQCGRIWQSSMLLRTCSLVSPLCHTRRAAVRRMVS